MDSYIEIKKEDVPIVREKVCKIKVIVLDSMNKHPLTNPNTLTIKERKYIYEQIKEIFYSNTLDEINDKFNTICNDKLFNDKSDCTQFPVYIDRRVPEQQLLFDETI